MFGVQKVAGISCMFLATELTQGGSTYKNMNTSMWAITHGTGKVCTLILRVNSIF